MLDLTWPAVCHSGGRAGVSLPKHLSAQPENIRLNIIELVVDAAAAAIADACDAFAAVALVGSASRPY